ncbi:MAG: outer membrane lipoprotein carrier protein LolA [Candidatus Fermentibacteraceae bacterium]|nr:outer membrane lipoprotein carrier protein LolA [Candidatus Fermentibacteraceae bacterium]MBN2609096.1 outer membrane lipoprotein carrier protein LolA [Candidatus Fermentibacteraceae bacterium]
MIQLLALLAAVSSSPLSPLLDKLSDTGYMTGSFSQTDFWALTLEEESSSGIMHLALPDLFRLSYSDPEGSETGFDGTVLYTVEPDLRQVIIYPSREPESFLHLLSQCDDSTICRTLESGEDSLLFELEGDFGQGIRLMEVGFTLSDSLPFLFSTTDYNGNTTTYRLRDLVTSADCPDGVFSFSAPDGYEIIDPEGM